MPGWFPAFFELLIPGVRLKYKWCPGVLGYKDLGLFLKVIFISFCLFVALLPVQVVAEVTLTLDSCLQTHVVNGKGRAVAPGDSLTLANGSHQLVVDCTANIGRSDDDAFPETSDTFVVLFEAEDVELTLSTPAIGTRRNMESFNRQRDFSLVDGAGTSVSYQVDVLEKEGFQVFRDYAEELEAFNRTSSAAATSLHVPGMAIAARDGDGKDSGPRMAGQGTPDQETVRQMLRYWYLQADKETRNEWKNWIQSSN